MKQITLGIIAMMYCMSIHAQTYQRRSAEEKARFYTNEMATSISLDSFQVSQVYDINLQVSKRFDSLYAGKPEKDVQRQVTIDILKDRDAAYRKILSPVQFLKFDDIQREKRERKRAAQLAKDSLLLLQKPK
jgi:hypothetical protein